MERVNTTGRRYRRGNTNGMALAGFGPTRKPRPITCPIARGERAPNRKDAVEPNQAGNPLLRQRACAPQRAGQLSGNSRDGIGILANILAMLIVPEDAQPISARIIVRW